MNTFNGNKYDYNFTRYVGWNKDIPGYEVYFTTQNMNFIKSAITNELLKSGYYITVTDEVIGNVMSRALELNSPNIGDIYTRYNIPHNQIRDDVKEMSLNVINTIVNTILDEQDQLKWNNSLTVWTTVLGDFNKQRIRSHPVLKTKERDIPRGPQTMSFNY